ncbi:hypothetical protein, partial [Gemmatimonas sp.]|uniref:hypothetical protein n=1 Tax=Gemmatimonas sp. TaxID=1962908 RepID=UPI0037C02237
MSKRFALAAALAAPVSMSAQQPAIASWVAFDAPVGLEMRTTPSLIPTLNAFTGGTWKADAAGNLVLRKGSGSPKRVVACGIDRAGFAVTQITADGLLRLHRVGNVAHPLWDQAHEGQQLEILTDRGPVTAVAAIANGHFAQQHRRDSLVVSADDLWVDVGASSPAEVAALGVKLLDPVQRRLDAWSYSEQVAGSFAAQRAGCAALVTAARGTVTQGETMFIISTQSTLGWPGLGGVLARAPQFKADEITLLMGGRSTRTQRWARAGALPAVNIGVFRAARADSVRVLSPAVRHANTLVESLNSREAEWLLAEVTKAAGVSSTGTNTWATIPRRRRASAHADTPAAGDAHASTMKLLASLADLPGVPMHEWRVREAIRAALPAWAQQRAVVDSVGNLIVSIGPARDTVVFMAHMDEVAYHVAGIRGDGTVTLRERGGVVNSAWEGQPAVLHLSRGADGSADTIPGIFVPRDSARLRQPGTLTAWFGMDSAALVARGVRVGLGVNSPKVSARLFGPR